MRNFILFLLVLAVSLVYGNNIMVDNIVLADQNAENGTTQIRFDLSWDNSWRVSVGPANWDAAWVFAKYRVNGNIWRPCSLSSATPAPGSSSAIDLQDGIGAFVYRGTDGSGDVNYQGMELQWDYGADGVDPNAVVDVQVFAIEMVYVPEGAFFMGTGAFDQANLNGNFFTLAVQTPFVLRVPYEVSGEGAITVANSAGNLYYDNSEGSLPDDIGDQAGPIPADFPKGYAAFYVMKYEVTQDQWVSFFNTLTDAQKANLDVTGPTGKNSDDEFVRNGISWPDAGNATTTLPDVALNYVAATMTLSYLDWAGLRPITELEFEKACRGPLPAINSEYAWGNANLHNAPYSYVNEGTPEESITDPGVGTGNAIVSSTNGTPSGPKRVGILAASAQNNTREESGGSYYGVMELTGNVYERCITVGNPPGRAFTGNHGDGLLTFSGAANVPGWPTSALGIGYRGGSYANLAPFITVSDRNDAANEITNGNTRLGFRGGRTAQ
ncbi:MAG: SUMF1/EgtB/PvdO family nonheme iron enzyme [Bacteroidota bacterium]